MRIVKLETMQCDAGWRNWSFLKLTTDEGLAGWAEYNEGYGAGGVSEIVQKFAPLVVGMDPREVGKIGATLRASTRMATGGLNYQAIAQIENACLDVKAKALGVPVCALFGGPFRDRIMVYWSHCASFRTWRPDVFEQQLGMAPIRTLDDVKRHAQEVARRGFKALKTNYMPLWPGARPFNPGFRLMPGMLDRRADNRYIGEIKDILAAFREGAGPDMGLLFDLNFNQRTDGFMRIAKAVEPYALTWLEMDIHDPEALAAIRRSSATPVGSLETIHGLRDYRAYLENRAVDVAIVDVHWNGVWEGVRIATLADAYEVDVAPHNYTGHLASLISAHFCAAVPNFRIMEIEIDDVPWKDDLVSVPPVIENGDLVLPTGPGWGAEVNEEAIRAHPPRAQH